MIPRGIAIWAFACVLAACAKVGAPPSRQATLVIAVAQEPASLNPLYLQGSIGYAISELGYSYLTNYDSLGNIVPDVAATVPSRVNGGISIDGERVVYHLRRDVSWQDGAPLNSHDVAFTYSAIMNASNAVPSRYGYDRVASVEAHDPYTVVVKLKRPYSANYRLFFRRRQQLSDPPRPSARALCEPRPSSIQRRADRLGPLPLRALGARRSVGDDGKSAILCRASGHRSYQFALRPRFVDDDEPTADQRSRRDLLRRCCTNNRLACPSASPTLRDAWSLLLCAII